MEVDPDAKRLMMDVLHQYMERVEAGYVEALAIAIAAPGSTPYAYVMPTDGDDPITQRLMDSVMALQAALTPATCGTCGSPHRGLLCTS